MMVLIYGEKKVALICVKSLWPFNSVICFKTLKELTFRDMELCFVGSASWSQISQEMDEKC